MNKDTDKLFKKELGSVADNILKGNFNKVDRLIIDIDGCICNNTYTYYIDDRGINIIDFDVLYNKIIEGEGEEYSD